MRISKKLAALCAFFVLVAVAVAGCGGSSNSVGSSSVAVVAGNQVPMRSWTHWMYLTAKNEQEQEAEEGSSTPLIMATDPPHFTACVKQLKALGYKSGVLKSDCDSVFTQYNSSVLTELIENYWYQGVASKVGIKITNADVKKQFNKDVKSHFKTTASYKAYLKESGYTTADIMWLERLSVVEQKLLAHYTKPVTSVEISGYYSENPSKFETPASRDAHVLRVNSAAQAQAAYAALKSGSSWTTVVKKYESGATSKNNGGLLTDITQTSSSTNELEAAVLKVIFASKVGQLVGPTKGTLGYYVTEVTKTVAPSKTPFNAATQKQIKSTLTTDGKDKAVSTINALAKKYFAKKTTCRNGYAVATYCANYASAKPTTIKATTTASSSATKTSTSSSSGTKSSKKK